ncbi:MAG: hypothetical protein VX278_06585 [Myxococcota bacterium]|nr:hypothetical protein [Myxococcota bacterium]
MGFWVLLCSLSFAEEPVIDEFQGVYTYVDNETDRKNIKDGLDRTVSEFNVVFRPVVKHILNDAAKVAHRVEVQVEKENITLVHYRKGEIAQVSGPLNQDISSTIRSDMKHKVRWTENGIERLDQTKDGGREVTYQLSKDKKNLFVHIKMFSSRLRKPFEYSLTYVRKLVKKKK